MAAWTSGEVTGLSTRLEGFDTPSRHQTHWGVDELVESRGFEPRFVRVRDLPPQPEYMVVWYNELLFSPVTGAMRVRLPLSPPEMPF